MRNRHLHRTLHALAEDAGLQLSADLAQGAEVPFELTESKGSRVALYAYRPKTDAYIRSRMGTIGRLPSYTAAAQTLERLGGLRGYLRVRGERRIPEGTPDRVDAALRSFLEHAFGETTDFAVSEERFETAFDQLEQAI